MPDSLRSVKDTVKVPGEGFVDVTTTAALWKDFKAPEALIRKGDWVDRPSVGIPYLYVSTGVVLGEALSAQGDAKGAAEAMKRARLVARATQLEDLFGAEQPSAPVIMPQGDTALGPKAPAKGPKGPVKAPAKKP